MLIDEKKRGGFSVPDLCCYYEACVLTWLKDWTTLKSERLLILEGHDLRFGWHAYLWYAKRYKDSNFGNHFIRPALLRVWEKYTYRFYYNEIPSWASPLEARNKKELGMDHWLTYEQILKREENESKTFEEL